LASGTPAPTAPSASFTASATSGTAPLSVNLTDTSTGDPTSWAWDLGNGSTSTAQNPSATYTTAGTYTVTLRATNAAGTSTAATRTITVTAPGGPTTKTVTLTATADAHAKQAAATTSYGSAASLWVDSRDVDTNASSAVHAYLRFEVPALAAGESITAARLSLEVNNPTGNGPALYPTDPVWDESTLTWGSGRPARTSSTTAGNYAAMANGRVSTAVTGVTAGGDVSYELAPESTDGFGAAAHEAVAASRPQLILTISS
jgi:PKD repeat protein